MHLAQVNIAKMIAPIDSPVMKGFVDNLDPINLLAESSPGFIWRLKEENNNATSIKIFDDEFLIVNMSVWESIDSLFQYVYKSDHTQFIKRKKEWFERIPEMHMALWFVLENHKPTVAEALERLVYLRSNQETPYAFTFKKRFTPKELVEYSPSQQ